MKRFWGAVAALFLLSLLNLFPAPAQAANCPGFSYTLTNGQVADATQVMSNFNTLLNCSNNSLAHNGVNADITSLTGLTTPIGVSQGGTGQTTSIFASTNSWTGVQTYSIGAIFSGSLSTLAATFPNIGETATVSATAATGTINYDVTTQSVIYYTTAASANWTLNFRANSGATLNSLMSIGQSVTAAFLATQGATPFYNNVVQVDGTTSGVTMKWMNGAPAGGTANGIDTYTFTIIKTAASTYTVLATLASYR